MSPLKLSVTVWVYRASSPLLLVPAPKARFQVLVNSVMRARAARHAQRAHAPNYVVVPARASCCRDRKFVCPSAVCRSALSRRQEGRLRRGRYSNSGPRREGLLRCQSAAAVFCWKSGWSYPRQGRVNSVSLAQLAPASWPVLCGQWRWRMWRMEHGAPRGAAGGGGAAGPSRVLHITDPANLWLASRTPVRGSRAAHATPRLRAGGVHSRRLVTVSWCPLLSSAASRPFQAFPGSGGPGYNRTTTGTVS